MNTTGVIADIKSRLPVVELVSETVPLKRAGASYKGLCPFHAEKTPSFIVSPERESWHCFGCGEHGDVFTFLMKRDGLDFREALARLAERTGVELSPVSAREDRRRQRLRAALDAAIGWYRDVLRQARQAEVARRYLAEREFTAETLERFSIGFAPAGWDALSRRLLARGFTNDELVGAGLASAGQKGRLTDRFRSRIIFPIYDPVGHAIGLGGRVLPDGDGPKYLNSPATPLFDKGRALFGIHLARTAIRRERLAVIVEGYTDVMSAHQAGFANVVASLGTALTSGQVELATRYADGVALAYDVDLAGEAATERGLLEELGPDHSVAKVRVIRIPAGKDPDDLVRTDPDGWGQAVAAAKPVVEYFMDRVASGVNLGKVEGRREMAARVLPILQRVLDPLEQDLYLQQLSRTVGVEPQILRDALRRPRSRRPVAHAGGRVALPVGPVHDPLELEAMALLLRHRGLAAQLDGTPLPFRDTVAQAVVTAWQGRLAVDATVPLETFLADLEPITATLAETALAAPGGAGPALDEEAAVDTFRTCLLRLRRARIDEAIAEGRGLLDDAQRDGDHDLLQRIELRISVLGREKADVTRQLLTPALPVRGGT